MEPKVTCVLAMVLLLAVSTLAQGQGETCDVPPRERSNCGYSGITREECENRGCCFNDQTHGVPWCFQSAAIPRASEIPEEEECPF